MTGVQTCALPICERSYDVRRWTEMTSGGHFAALEAPQLLAEEVRAFFRGFRNL